MRDALLGFLDSHARRENRVSNGNGHQFIVFCTCALCATGLAALGMKEAEFEVIHDSNPFERAPMESDI